MKSAASPHPMCCELGGGAVSVWLVNDISVA